MGAYGRVFDVTVLGRPDGANGHTRLSTVEAALFETGRPVLIAPPVAPKTLGTTIVIAWNRSTETARAVLGSMPLLPRPAGSWFWSWRTGACPARRRPNWSGPWRCMAFAAEALMGSDPSNKPGEAILGEATALGCDLLVKGAYTQSRLRQMFFGGATSHILGNTTMPVLMAH